MTMTMTVTNDSLILLGLMVVGLTLYLYGCYYTEGGDAIEVQQPQYEASLEEIKQDDAGGDKEKALLNGARERAATTAGAEGENEDLQDNAEGGDSIEVQQQQQAEDAAREDEARNRDHDNVLEEIDQDQIEDEARHNEALLDEMLNQEEEANEGVMVQQQYRVLYNPIHRHMWTIFRNPNPGMISLFQMINNIYSMGTWVSNLLQLQVQQASAANNEEEEEENEEEEEDDDEEEYNAGHFERTSSKLDYDKVSACFRDFGNNFPEIYHELAAHFNRLGQFKYELASKFYASIAEALKECNDYIEWIVPYYRPYIAPINEEGNQQEEDNSFSDVVGIGQVDEDEEVYPTSTVTTTPGINKNKWTQADLQQLHKCIERFGNNPKKVYGFFDHKTEQEFEQMFEQMFRKYFDDNDDREGRGRKQNVHAFALEDAVSEKEAAADVVSITVPSKKKPGIPLGTKKDTKRSPEEWDESVAFWVSNYSHFRVVSNNCYLSQTEFLSSHLSDKWNFIGTPTRSEKNGFSERYCRDYIDGKLKNPPPCSGVGVLETAPRDVFDFPAASVDEDANDNNNSSTSSSMIPPRPRRNPRRGKKRKKDTTGSSNSQQKKRRYIRKKNSDEEWLPSNGNDDDDGEWRHDGLY